MNKVQLDLRSFKKELLKVYLIFLIQLIQKLKLKYFIVSPPKRIKKITLLKSPHVHKKAREQFQFCLYKKTVHLKDLRDLNYLNHVLINKPKLININVKFKGK